MILILDTMFFIQNCYSLKKEKTENKLIYKYLQQYLFGNVIVYYLSTT